MMIAAASLLAIASASALILGLGWSVAAESTRQGDPRPAMGVI
ncbi:hypothetical protein [Methylobacterium sp. sgz302541]